MSRGKEPAIGQGREPCFDRQAAGEAVRFQLQAIAADFIFAAAGLILSEEKIPRDGFLADAAGGMSRQKQPPSD